ncbi:MAG: hypothetical protein COA52_01160 [Hyphomicrobiales bacterium]|nr:MAG: hypothetical protein COA52_00070 [Hyphomicrobiales bacterium]PCJ96846.1 MAG: hypothetical protein COA52_01160 [Hyphomicrobiales bacterium]
MLENINAAIAEYETKRKVLSEVVQKELTSSAQEILKEATFIKRIYWVQYTPGFNDGEPCEFSLGEICYQLEKEEDEDFEEYEGDSMPNIKSLEEQIQDYIDYENNPKDFAEKCRKKSKHSYHKQDRDYLPWHIKHDTKTKIEKELVEAKAIYNEFGEENVQKFLDFMDVFEKSIRSSEDILEEIFGNGFMINITKGNVEIEEYDCGY